MFRRIRVVGGVQDFAVKEMTAWGDVSVEDSLESGGGRGEEAEERRTTVSF